MDIKARFKNPIFWIGLISIIFSAAGIKFETLVNWDLFIDAIQSIAKNPVAIVAVITSIVGVFTNTSTPGLKDNN